MSWDLIGKALAKECAQDFFDYFAPSAKYIGLRNGQLQTRMGGPFRGREIRADNVLEGVRGGERILMNIEWQSTRDGEIDERLLFYSCELTRESDLVVLPVAIHLQPISEPPPSPLTRVLPGDPLPWGNELITFHFISFQVYDMPVEELRAIDRDAFSVLMLLSKGGATRAVLDEVLERLFQRKDERRDSIIAAFFFADKVMASEEDSKYIKRRREMFQGSLQESRLYKELYAEAQEEALERGLEKGLEKGRLEEARKNIAVLAQVRFPELLDFVQEQISSLTDQSRLQEILILVGTARTADDVRFQFDRLLH